MVQLAIIAEYNPYHNGHAYLIEQAKTICSPDSTIAVMSGNFLQRGEPAAWNKYTRASMACSSDIDVVFELPFPYATGSALDFATGAINLLHKLGTVTHLAFGVETENVSLFHKITDILVNEPEAFRNELQDSLSEGYSYPKSRATALEKILEEDISQIINSPNNILAIEYICALKRLHSNIQPILIKRVQAEYHDSSLHGTISSATAIRQAYSKSSSIDMLNTQVPHQVYNYLALPKQILLDGESLTPYVQGLLLHPSLLKDICDFNHSMQDKFAKCKPTASYSQVIEYMKSKDLTRSRIARAILHSILLYTEIDRQQFTRAGNIFYANVLALKKESSAYLRTMQDCSQIPIITKKADFEKCIKRYENINSTVALRMWQLDQKATQLYNTLYYNLYAQNLKNDYEQPLPVL